MNFQDYFQAYNNYFWRWEDDTEVLSIPQGSTIAYKQQIAHTLESMVDNGVPPFGALLLAFIATNNTKDDNIAFIENKLKIILNDHKKVYYTNSSSFNDVFIFLNRLKEIPTIYKTGKRRNLMLKTIFENCHKKVNTQTAKGLIEKLNKKQFAIKKLLGQKELSESVYQKDFHVIALLEKKFPTAKSIIDAMGDLPPINDEDLPELITETTSQETYKDFVEELIDNDQTFQVGALIKPIWAGFKIPIFSTLPSEQPLGGVSDLSNKGDFDKLLISEFANDDLVFMSRLANNEALYLHREMPPANDDLQRIILLDISLKMWGTPKTLAHAIYLAIAKHPKSSGTSQAFVVGDICEEIAFKHVDDMIDALQKVDISLHAGKGIEFFFNDVRNKKQLEIFYITTQETLKHAAIQKQLAENTVAFKYIITANAEGEISFYRNKNNAQKHLQTIRLPLEKLWVKKIKKNLKPINHFIEENHEYVYPILFSTPKNIKKKLSLNDDVYCVANKCLYKRSAANNKNNSRGWELMWKNLSNDGLFEIGKLSNHEILLLHFQPSGRKLEIINLNSGETDKTVFNEWNSKFHREFIFADGFIHLYQKPDGFDILFDNNKIKIVQRAFLFSYFDLYKERIAALNELNITPNNDIILLKNLTDVSISGAFNLVFNTQELRLDSEKGFYMQTHASGSIGFIRNYAKGAANAGVFQFADGSVVKMESSGIISLKSSNELIPIIYVPPVLTLALGLATENAFAGNVHFYNEHYSHVKVVLDKSGANLLKTVRIIRMYTSMGLHDCKHIAEKAPSVISTKITVKNAENMVKDLSAIGASATIHKPKNHQQQEIISIFQFQEKYLLPFIQHILAYATAN